MRHLKLRHVRAWLNFDPQFRKVSFFLIVLGQTFSNFPDRAPHGMIRSGVVVVSPAEDIRADRALFELIAITFQSAIDNVLKNGGVAFAIPKNRAGQNPLELRAHRVALPLGRRNQPGKPRRELLRRHDCFVVAHKEFMGQCGRIGYWVCDASCLCVTPSQTRRVSTSPRLTNSLKLGTLMLTW